VSQPGWGEVPRAGARDLLDYWIIGRRAELHKFKILSGSFAGKCYFERRGFGQTVLYKCRR